MFGYVEQGEEKSALVKIRLCEKCSRKLNYRQIKEEKKKRKRGAGDDKVEKVGEELPMEDHLHLQKHHRSEQETEIPKEDLKDDEQEPENDNVWAAPIDLNEIQGVKTKEQEMDEFFADLFS